MSMGGSEDRRGKGMQEECEGGKGVRERVERAQEGYEGGEEAQGCQARQACWQDCQSQWEVHGGADGNDGEDGRGGGDNWWKGRYHRQDCRDGGGFHCLICIVQGGELQNSVPKLACYVCTSLPNSPSF